MEVHDCLDGSNNPIEDANAHQIIQRDQSDGEYLFFAVMDSHGGRKTSQLLSRILLKATVLEIANLSTSSKPGVLASLMGKQASSPHDADPAQMSLAIQKAFENLDSDILKAPLRVLAENMDAESRKLNKIPDVSQAFADHVTGNFRQLRFIGRDCCAVAGVWEPSADGTGAWRVDVKIRLEGIQRNLIESSHWTDWNSSKLYILSFLDAAEARSLWESTELVSVALSLSHDVELGSLEALSLAGTMFPRISSPTIIPRRNVKIHIDDFLAVISKHFPNLRILCLMDMHQALIWTPPQVPSCIQSSSDLPFEDVVACTRWLALRISEASPSIIKVSVRESNSSAAGPLQSHIRSVVKTCREI
ncbi:hypothetical protein C8J56DRAFT_1174115 [Mycena floridula]|nr:hypothetical protein C8J56DRAFT_1174115 [Mycena floridula]